MFGAASFKFLRTLIIVKCACDKTQDKASTMVFVHCAKAKISL